MVAIDVQNVFSSAIPMIYTDVPSVTVSKESTIVGYEDDIAVITVAKRLANVELHSSEATTAAKEWLENAGIALSEDKAKAILIM